MKKKNNNKWKIEEKPHIYLSGVYAGTKVPEEKWLKLTGCTHRCFSFGYSCPGAFVYQKRVAESLAICVKEGVNIMMDSSAFTFHEYLRNTSGQVSAKKQRVSQHDIEKFKEDTIRRYIEYCKRMGKDWDFYVNFDYIKHCPTIYKVQKRLEEAGINPVPVYHGDKSLDWLRRYCDGGYKLIGIGSDRNIRRTFKDKRYFLDKVFEITNSYDVALHGFAVTSLSLMFDYPWYSVDSATWTKVSAMGCIMFPDPVRNIISQVHISSQRSKGNSETYNRMPKAVQKAMQDKVEAFGFPWKKMRDEFEYRTHWNAWVYYHFEELGVKDFTSKRVKWQSLL